MPDKKLNSPLREWTVLSLRPYGQHAAAHCASQLRESKFLACSSIKLVAMENDADLEKALGCKYVIVTSPAAARFAAKSPAFRIGKNTGWFALGEGTASVLRKNGVLDISIPQNGSTSEHLLSMPALQNIVADNIGLVTAPGGRGLIESALLERGANVQVAHVYQRKVVALPHSQMQKLARLKLPFAVLCSSHEVFESFWRQLSPALQEKLRKGLWVLSSPRLEALLHEAGITGTTISPSAGPEAMLAHLEHVQMQQVR